jgi:hypothetical protein
MTRESGESREDDQKDKCHNVDMVIDAVRSETDDASVEPQQKEKEDQAGQQPHHAQRPRGVAFETHLVVGCETM